MNLPLDTIICGDNVETMQTFPDGCIDLTVTSPPYDNLRTYGGHAWDFEGVAAELWRITKPGGVVVWVVADATVNGSETGTSFRQALRFMEIGFRLHDTMIYQKVHTGGARGSNLAYWQAFEFMFVLSRGTPSAVNLIEDRKNAIGHPNKNGTYTSGGKRNSDGTLEKSRLRVPSEYGRRTNVWKLSTADVGGDHPAPFPESLARDHILSWSNEGDTVLDCFNGSGTTTKMARAMGRRWLGIEINPEYCEIARRRMAQQVLF